MEVNKEELDSVLDGNVLILAVMWEEDKVGEVRVELEKMFEVEM